MQSEETEERVMRCFYEVLGVERDAEEAELRTAYRKLALEWHPDKNMHQLELADKMFKEIQTAYTTLMDPNERAWYDSHREAILRGRDGTAEDGGEEQAGMNLWPYFSTSCFSGFGDDEEGFYSVYRDVFEQLDAEEEEVEDEDEYHDQAPSFGNSKTPYSEVKKFYTFWSDFVSKRSFSYCDVYKTTEAPNRKVKRLMEKDNKKARDKARKARNDQVRHLVDFIKNRDKRVAEAKLQEKIKEEERLKLELQRKEELKEKNRLLRVQAEAERKAWEDQLSDSEFDYIEEEEQQELQDLYCAVCKKSFRSQKQWQNHERSKSHKDKLTLLREELMYDGEELPESEGEEDEMQEQQPSDVDTPQDVVSDQSDDEEAQVIKPKDKKKKKKKKNVITVQIDSDDEEVKEMAKRMEELEIEKEEIKKEKKRSKKEKRAEKEKAKQQMTEDQPPQPQPQPEPMEEPDRKKKAKEKKGKAKKEEVFKCNVCSAEYPTRNSLFIHIKKENHAFRK
eukprot:TRINITY_DN10072_c0_g1_i1.p1 TRINITY_DN10072_c0_g1~~TRINITY_DN10072_c0_g1_i1.p1  ORF type:complete len:507 (+),score=169.07 TRINITY_DN10072_c0_g1_i1:53-1573(+)